MQNTDIQPKFGKDSEFITHRVSYKDIDDKNIYQLASVSKSYTGVLANLMALDGKFGETGLNTNLVQLFESCGTEEATKIANILKEKGFENATIEKVLNHTSGIGIINYKSIATNPERSANIISGERAMSDVEFLQEELPEKDKHWKEPFGYANEGFFLFQKLVDNLPGSKGFEQEMEERVLKPLGLTNTGFSGDDKIADKEQRVHNYIPDGETLVSLGAKNTTGKLQKTEANKLLPTGTAIKAAGGLSASMGDLAKFAEQIPAIYSNHKIAQQLYNASYQKGKWIEGDVTRNICLYSCGIYIDVQPSEKSGKIKVVFRHQGNLFGGFETAMQSACEYDFKGTPEEFVEAMKNGVELKPTILPNETKAEYEKYDGLAQEMLKDTIVGEYHVKLLYEVGNQAVKDSKISQQQFDEVCQNAKLVAKSGERYAINMGLQNLKVDTGSLWVKCKELGDNLQTEIFNKFSTKEGILDSGRLLEIATNPKAFQQLKHQLVEKCIPKAQTNSIQNEELTQSNSFVNNLKLEPNFKQDTISSLMKKGREDLALESSSNMKSQKSFVEALKERREKEAESNKGQSK